jgi:predicted Rossmann fold nucleotide-binding protein DprA/Smf involved in DNA uptake
LDKRTKIISLRLTAAEFDLWAQAAHTEHKDPCDFIRTKVNDYIFHKKTETLDVDMGPVLQELRDIQELMVKRSDLMDINRQMLVQNAAALNITDEALEMKILDQLGTRSLYTTQIIEFVQQAAEIVIPILLKLEKEGKIEQNNQRRWKHQ